MSSNLRTLWGVYGVLFLTLGGAAVMFLWSDSRSRRIVASNYEATDWAQSAHGVEPLKLQAPPGPDRGKEIYTTVCIACHGPNAGGMRALNSPSLHQQKAWYIAAQLRKFREGTRGNHPDDTTGAQMRAMVAGLPDPGAFDDLAAFVISLDAPIPVPEGNGDTLRGQEIYLRRCSPCHGKTGEGSDVYRAPTLAGQSDWYVAAQLEKFKTGIRGADARDKAGILMQWMAAPLSEPHRRDVTAYIATLRTGEPQDSLERAANPIQARQEIVSDEPSSTPPPSPSPEVTSPPPTPASDTDAAAEAAEIFQTRCVACHGVTGNGDGPAGMNLPVKPRAYSDPTWQASVTDKELAAVIIGGGPAVGKSVFMVPNPDLGGKPKVLAELIKIIRGFKK